MKNKSSREKSRRPDKSYNRSRRTPQSEKFYLFGIHTVAEALENSARAKHRLLVTLNAAQRLEKQISKYGRGMEIFEASPQDLDNLVGRDAVHQGVVLDCDPLAPKNLDDLAPGATVMVLDQISDPHNVGAIMRSCVAMGVGALITTSRNSAPQTSVLAKSASGALDLIDLIEVSNLSKAIQTLNSQGYQSIGLDSEGPDILENSIDPSAPVALVLGAEGKGLRQKTRETCSTLARLDMPGKIKSLNVSNAAILALYVAGLNRLSKP
jgi:23S rRNA (guanosine2251-2'-O)-methyltransferase